VLTFGLFTWWTISISWNIVFLILAGFYLYASSRAKRKEETRKENKREMDDEHSARARGHKTQLKVTVGKMAKNFIFVWILLGLLVFYIFSVQMGTGKLSEAVFAGGNIAVEALLVFYLVKNRDKIPAREHAEKAGREMHAEAHETKDTVKNEKN
jgi:hypothetical protein